MSLPVHWFIVSLYATAPTARSHGGVVSGSDKRYLQDKRRTGTRRCDTDRESDLCFCQHHVRSHPSSYWRHAVGVRANETRGGGAVFPASCYCRKAPLRCHSLLLVHCREPTSLQAVGEYRVKLPPPLCGSTGDTVIMSSSSSSSRRM